MKSVIRATPQGEPPEGGTWAMGPRADRPLVSSIRIVSRYHHAEVHVWTRGAKAGHLVVDAEDADGLARRLMGDDAFVETHTELKLPGE